MKRFWIISGTIATVVLTSFLIVEALHVPLLVDPTDRMEHGGLAAAAISAGLLLADIFLPVPSSIVMALNGSLFGIVAGTALSLVSSVGSAMIGWWIGHANRDRMNVAGDAAPAMIAQWGVGAIVISRFLPIVAETVSIMSGAAGFSWRTVLIASSLGTLPAALIYAVTGSLATDISSGLIVAGCVFLLALLAWRISLRLQRSAAAAHAGDQ